MKYKKKVSCNYYLKLFFVLGVVGQHGALHLFVNHHNILPFIFLTFPGILLLIISQSGFFTSAGTLIHGSLCPPSFAKLSCLGLQFMIRLSYLVC